MPRYAGPDADAVSPAQAAVMAEVRRTRPRTGCRGPFGPWLANAELAQCSQALGRICRYATSLSPKESELAILATAAHHDCATEFAIHEGEALAAGLGRDDVEALRRGDAPILAGCAVGERARLRAVHGFVRELLQTSRVGDEAYAEACAHLGEAPALVELVAVVGYYAFVALTLNAFDVPP